MKENLSVNRSVKLEDDTFADVNTHKLSVEQ